MFIRLKNENSVLSSFRMPDLTPKMQAVLPVGDVQVKTEPETDSSGDSIRCSEESDQSESVKAPKFVDVKNRYIFDCCAKNDSIKGSTWSNEWFAAVESKYRLRRNEAAKKVGLAEKLNQLLAEVVEVARYFS